MFVCLNFAHSLNRLQNYRKKEQVVLKSGSFFVFRKSILIFVIRNGAILEYR